MTDSDSDAEREIYIDCIRRQLEEVDLLASIYCAPGEMQIIDAGVIRDFNDFLKAPTTQRGISLNAHLDYVIQLTVTHDNVPKKIDIRIELPHLYPRLQYPIVAILSPLLSKSRTDHLRNLVEQFIMTLDKTETYVFQVITWLQERIEEAIGQTEMVTQECLRNAHGEDEIDFERLWIYAHHIKAKLKRQEIIKQARNLQLSGFSRPGKPGIICVEGLREDTQEFWRLIKSMHWQKISVCKCETKREQSSALLTKRRFEGFKEQLFCDDPESEADVMNMAAFIEFLKANNSGYMTKTLFGFDSA